MVSGIGMEYKGQPSTGKHLSTGHEYPDSPCGSGDHDNFVYELSKVTCPACKAVLKDNAKATLKALESTGE